MSDNGQLLIVYSESGNAFYQELARRLATACAESSEDAALLSTGQVCDMTANQLTDTALALVNPYECVFGVNAKSEFLSKLATARKRIMVLAEAVETRWYEQQLQFDIEFDAFFDVGFMSQEEKLSTSDVPYRFVFNGPTKQEEITISGLSPSRQRYIPWALVGHQTIDRLKLAVELVDNLDPRGFVFLPEVRPVRRGEGMISPSDLASVLSRTSYYVWSSHHSFAYYESFRFIEALLAGAVPCKIDSETAQKWTEIPGIFPSAQSFCATVQDEDFWSMYCSARDFYLSKGSLATNLKEALQVVRS